MSLGVFIWWLEWSGSGLVYGEFRWSGLGLLSGAWLECAYGQLCGAWWWRKFGLFKWSLVEEGSSYVG